MGGGDAEPRRLTHSNSWFSGMRLARQEVVRFKARDGDVPAAVEFGRVAAAPVNTLRQQTHRCQEISVCF